MRRLRTSLALIVLAVAVSLSVTPVLAGGQNPGGNGQNCPSGQGCPPGAPTLSESHFAVLLPLIAIALVGGIIGVVYLRQRARVHAATS